jgi:hypothetical protein
MNNKYLKTRVLLSFIIAASFLAYWLKPEATKTAGLYPPQTSFEALERRTGYDKPCLGGKPEWRKQQTIDGVDIAESEACNPDNPYVVAAAVKGINNISMGTLMQTHMAEDALIKSDDLDGDGDPDIIRIKLEVIELNGSTPDNEDVFPSYDIAPGIRPGMWVFAPKSRGMSVTGYGSTKAHNMLRGPSPVIRVEQGDKVYITLENTHYLPHTIHLHGVDHPWQTAQGSKNDGVPLTGAMPVFPGQSKTYEIQPRQPGTMFYHCHVQTDKHLKMGLNSMFVVEENRPNNWLQTFNIGAGHVRHSSVAIQQSYDKEYDLVYQAIDKNLASTIQQSNDPRVIAQLMNRDYNITESNENYFLLNGHSFPYTLRESLIVVEPDQNIKLRMVNAQSSSMAIHFHGHKATITDYDGVKQAKAAQITRDVYDMAPAQRLDIHLQTVNDGLHSYGEGIWLFHDHAEKGITTDGITPGGNVSALVYKSLLDKDSMPKVRPEAISNVFDVNYYARNKPIWGTGKFALYLGDVRSYAANYPQLVGFGLMLGIIISLLYRLLRGTKKGVNHDQ